jgi:hypothetical protein
MMPDISRWASSQIRPEHGLSRISPRGLFGGGDRVPRAACNATGPFAFIAAAREEWR